jgi:hypothetical protein
LVCQLLYNNLCLQEEVWSVIVLHEFVHSKVGLVCQGIINASTSLDVVLDALVTVRIIFLPVPASFLSTRRATADIMMNLIPCEWNPEFATRRDLDCSTENKPYIGWRAQLGVEDNVEARAAPGEEENSRYRLLAMRCLFQDPSLILPGPVDAGSSEVLLFLQGLIVWNEGMIL